jgi:hypothetical protein
MKKLIIISLVLIATMAQAAPYLHTNINTDGVLQGAAPDPNQTTVVPDNNSHTYSVKANIWYDLIYQGAGTCIVRLMNTVTKASWVAETVAAGGTHTYLIHGNTNYLNYSGCLGSGKNSVLHFQ